MPEAGRQRKNQPWRGNVKCRGIDIPFSKYQYTQGIWLWTKEGRSSLRQLQAGEGRLLSIKGYDVTFHRYNFRHLTGVRVNSRETESAIHFYEKCLAKRLAENDFSFAQDGSTAQKLDIMENMMHIKHNAAMIGDFTDRGPKLYTEKVAGGVCGCIGFVKDKNTRLNVPNTLPKKDIRDITVSPVQKVYAVFSKSYTAEKYSVLEKADESIDMEKCLFSEMVEKMLDRGGMS